MKVPNFFQINDWKIKNFICIILVMHLILWSSIELDRLGLQIPLLRQLIGFIYLSFIPGIIILRILKLHKLGNIETLLYSVGLSIAVLMFIGFFINLIYPLLGFSKPLLRSTLIITINLVVLILCFLSFKVDNNYSDPSFIDVKDILSPQALILNIIPLIAIFGTYMVNYYNNNLVLMFLIVIIVLIATLIGFNKLILAKFYPLAIFTIAISLLFHNSLISMYIWGWDIQIEYYMANVVVTNSFWNSNLYSTLDSSNVNAMLSIVILSPIIHAFTNMSLIWIFKIIYPAFFSLVPVGLYQVYQKQTNNKIAFFSVLFFMFVYIFYTEMLQLARQQVAELFLVLIILLLLDKEMNKLRRSLLLIIFTFSLSVSHYGLTYLIMTSLIIINLIYYLCTKFYNKKEPFEISKSFILLLITFTLTWYMYNSNSSALESFVYICRHILSSISTDLLSSPTTQGTEIILFKTPSYLHDFSKYIHITSQFLIIVGFLNVIVNRCQLKFKKEFVAFSGVNFIFLICCIIVPFFANSLNTTRIYHISLIFLAPFCIIGGISVINIITNNKYFTIDKNKNLWMKILSVFLSLLLLFNSGWVYQLAKDNPASISLSKADSSIYNEQEVIGARWLKNIKNNYLIYGDVNRYQLLTSINNPINIEKIPVDITTISEGSYIFLGSYNIMNNKILITSYEHTSAKRQYFNYLDIINQEENKIYQNGYSEIYN